MKTPALLLLAASPLAAAPIELTDANLVYSENFDVLASTPNNSSTAPAGWTNDLTIPGWWWYIAGNAPAPTGLATAGYTYYVADGTAPPNTAPLAHGFYSLGAADSADRALGSSPTTGLGEISTIVILHNGSSGPLKLTNVKFTTEAYRANSTANNKDSLFVWVKTGSAESAFTTNATALSASNTTDFVAGTNTTGPTSYYITGWTHLPEFTRTTTNATVSAVLAPETNTFNAAPSAANILVAANEYVALRWSNLNDGGADAIHGIDDLELTFAPTTFCVLTPAATGIVRQPGIDPDSAADDSITFDITVNAAGGSAGGWVIPAGQPGAGTAGAYGAAVPALLTLADFNAVGNATIRIQDSGDPACFANLTVKAPPFIQKVSAANSPKITFTPAMAGAFAWQPPADDQSELGWAGGTAGGSGVAVQPNGATFTGTNKYWHLTSASTTFATDPVDVSALAGQTLEGRVGLSFYSTSSTGLDANDELNARMEVALDGDFANTAAGNILAENFINLPTGSTAAEATALGTALACAATYINLAAGTWPEADFTFHPYAKTITIPPGSTSARARIVFASGIGISTTEHVLLDDVRFSLSVAPADSDADNIPDAYEDANGLDKNNNADRDTDLDGDGQSNYVEFISGTIANDPDSVLRITAASMSVTGEISLTWNSVAGKKYRARVSSDFGDKDPWTVVGTTVTASGPSTTLPPGIIVPPGMFPRYFLRIELVP